MQNKGKDICKEIEKHFKNIKFLHFHNYFFNNNIYLVHMGKKDIRKIKKT